MEHHFGVPFENKVISYGVVGMAGGLGCRQRYWEQMSLSSEDIIIDVYRQLALL